MFLQNISTYLNILIFQVEMIKFPCFKIFFYFINCQICLKVNFRENKGEFKKKWIGTILLFIWENTNTATAIKRSGQHFILNIEGPTYSFLMFHSNQSLNQLINQLGIQLKCSVYIRFSLWIFILRLRCGLIDICILCQKEMVYQRASEHILCR